MKKLLVTGISGFLGKALALFQQQDWNITGLYCNHEIAFPNVETLRCDITENIDLEKVFQATKPAAVIHLAALSNSNYCELNPGDSYAVNVQATGELARLCAEHKIPMLFVSTDLVFDGEKAPYPETAGLKPLMIYGRHKARAEALVTSTHPRAIIVRLPVIFGKGGFMKSWIENLKKGDTVTAFTDEFRSTISAEDAIKGMLLLLKKQASGTWHLGGKERLSRYDFAIKMARVFRLPEAQIKAALRETVKMPAARPADVSLISHKAFNLGFNPRSIDDALRAIEL